MKTVTTAYKGPSLLSLNVSSTLTEVSETRKRRKCRQETATFVLLDAIRQNDEPNDNSHGTIQKPNVGMVLEDFGTDQNGKSHDAPHQRVKSYEKKGFIN